VIERWLFEEELDRAGAPYPPGSAKLAQPEIAKRPAG